MSILQLARPELLKRQGYKAAKGRFDLIRLHANEMPQLDDGIEEHNWNRYPPPRPFELNQQLAQYFDISEQSVLVTRGSNEGIDLMVRSFCRSGKDAIVINSPTFGLYRICAEVQGAACRDVPLKDDLTLDLDRIVSACKANGKIAFICSPANPTGNAIAHETVEQLCTRLAHDAIVVLDQAYAEFAESHRIIELLSKHQNLVVLRTFSKAYGLAGLRCGVVLGNPEIITLLDTILPPYAIPSPTIKGVMRALSANRLEQTQKQINQIFLQKARLIECLENHPLVKIVYPSVTNFVLVKFDQVDQVYEALLEKTILVRRFDHQPRLSGCLRITIGNQTETNLLIQTLKELD